MPVTFDYHTILEKTLYLDGGSVLVFCLWLQTAGHILWNSFCFLVKIFFKKNVDHQFVTLTETHIG